MKNTFTVKVRMMYEDTETQVIKGVTSIMSNLGGFLVSSKDGSYQFDGNAEIIIDGSDDYNLKD